MSPVSRHLGVLALGCAFLAAAGCSKKLGTPFDPDAGHPSGFFQTHGAAYRSSGGSCRDCHGADLFGGISTVSCFSASRDSQTCHPGGPGGHPADWLGLHTAIDPAQASACAACHDNPGNSLPPNCFNASLCHGQNSGHPANWRSIHSRTNPSEAASCARCHDNPANSLPPNCFNNSLCHGAQSPHPSGWRSSHTKTDPGQASACASCHQSRSGTPGCFNNTLCHGAKKPHPSGWEDTHKKTNPGQASACAECHRKNAGDPGCFNNTLCHGGEEEGKDDD